MRTIHPPPTPYILRQFPRLFSALPKMNPSAHSNGGQSPLPTSDLPLPEQDSSASTYNRFSETTRHQNTRNPWRDAYNCPKQLKPPSYSNPPFNEEWPPISATLNTSSKNKSRDLGKQRTRVELHMDEADECCSSRHEISPTEGPAYRQDEKSLPTCFGKKGNRPSQVWRQRVDGNIKKDRTVRNNPYFTKEILAAEPFDICLWESTNGPPLKDHLHPGGTEGRDELELPLEFKRPEDAEIPAVLRPGMVLLRSYLTHSEQIEMVKKCRELGVGPGGFYQPGYSDGAKLHLQMMCLGLYWDPQKRKYFERQSADGCTPPVIPQEFTHLVKKAIQDSHALIQVEDDSEISNVEDILPTMSPDICIVNFYTTTGRLGLHQDRDESEESLHKGLPVVSFSLGDSAEFLYGDGRDTEKAEKVVLKSGDVLIFGGKSRHIFHGVTSILPDSAPSFLLEESNLRPGRLNLTFRQY